MSQRVRGVDGLAFQQLPAISWEICFALVWSAVYALIAWRTTKWLYTMKSGLRNWVLLAIPIS